MSLTPTAGRVLILTSLTLLFLASLLLVFARVKQVSPISWGWFGQVYSTRDVAIQGFDPVAYSSGSAERGDERWSLEWNGATWHFANQENLRRFQGEPERFAPQFGGFCAFAVSKGFTAESNPSVFVVEEGETYLFNSDKVRDQWLAQATPALIDESRSRWSRH